MPLTSRLQWMQQLHFIYMSLFSYYIQLYSIIFYSIIFNWLIYCFYVHPNTVHLGKTNSRKFTFGSLFFENMNIQWIFSWLLVTKGLFVHGKITWSLSLFLLKMSLSKWSFSFNTYYIGLNIHLSTISIAFTL